MSEYREQRTIRQAVPVRNHPVVETQHDSVVHEHREISGVAVAALVLSAIAAATVITMLIMNTQQRSSDDLARERARNEAVQQTQPPQSTQPSSQPPVVVMPPSQPSAPVIVPTPSQSAPTTVAPSNVDIQIEITSKLLDDEELRSSPIDVQVSAGNVTLSGKLKSEDLKARAEILVKTVKGVKSVTNNITVEP